ncbi:3-carboxy-cis,cis-muconate cycloisomerase [Planktotalea sp.]|uniref:3-carboxy-cis,cis-muconate cycloisomerase n=1 Tax=Planktotalea sp. TaxID=2029877 RepID=UPI003D6B9C76
MSNAFTSSPLFDRLLGDGKVAKAFGAESYLQKMLAFERAWTQALMQVGAVEEATGAIALNVIDGFEPNFSKLGAGTERDGLPVPELVRQLRAGQTEAVQKAIHTGATSQDVMDSATVLICREVLLDFETRGREVLARIDALSESFGATEMMGRTRMQAALPIRVSDRLSTWQVSVSRHLEALPELVQSLATVQVGGAVGLRNTPNDKGDEVAVHVAKSLGLSVSAVWHADRTSIVNLGNWLALLTGTFGKIGADVTLMAQQGVDEVGLDGAGGSSAMPHKQNPVRAETLVTLARFVAGQQGILGQAMVHEQERSGTAWALEWMVLPSMLEAAGASLSQAQALLNQINRLGARD